MERRSILECAWAIFAIGVMLMMTGGAVLVSTLLGSLFWFLASVLCISVVGGLIVHRAVRRLGDKSKLHRNMRGASLFAGEWIPMLYGNYTPYVVEAAERLGEARETTAVPALMYVLEQAVNTQPPGWRDTAEALAVALGKMGDRRALPLLYRLTNWRGIGLLTAVHEAIDRIEPQTSLLRPGSADDLPTETLLRPAERGPESDSTLLLRCGQEPDSLTV